jgi:hypothetical protein
MTPLDIPSADLPYAERIDQAKALIRKSRTGWRPVRVANQVLKATNTDALRRELGVTEGSAE